MQKVKNQYRELSMASMVTLAPETSNKLGIAMISLFLSSVFSCPSVISASLENAIIFLGNYLNNQVVL